MGPKALQFIHAVARKLLAKPTKPSEGIITIGNRLQAESKAGEIAETFRLSGLTPDKWDEFIRSEKDVIKFLNIIESSKPKGPTIGGHRVIDASSSEGQGITRDFFNMLDRQSGKNVIKTDFGKSFAEEVGSADNIIKNIKNMEPIDAMAEANSVIGRKGIYKNLTPEESKKILKDTEDHIFERDIPIDPEDLADGGVAGLLGERSGYQDGLRVDAPNPRILELMLNEKMSYEDALKEFEMREKQRPYIEERMGTGPGPILEAAEGGPARQNFGLGGISRRAFLKWMAGAGAGIGAAKSGLFGLLKGGGKKQVIKELTSVPIKDISGMPAWFKPLVNKVIKEGDDVTKKFATADREIVHTTKLPNSQTDVIVTQDLTTGNVSVDIGMGKHGFKEGLHGQPVRLEYKAAEDIMVGPDMDDMHKVGVRDPHIKVKRRDEMAFDQKKHPDKAPEEFWVEEAEFTGGHPENVKFEDVSYEKFGEHGSNFDEVEKFATGKVKKTKTTESRFLGKKYLSEGDDFATGGRVPLVGGGVLKGILALGKGATKKAGEGKFTKNEVLLNMFQNTIKQSKSADTKTRFTNFIEEIKLKPELSKDPNVWNFFTKGLPKNQKLVVYGDDTVDFWTQSDFGPHNIATSAKFQKKHPYLTKDQAVKIQNMKPEDQIFEMKRLETIRKRTANASGGRVPMWLGGGLTAGKRLTKEMLTFMSRGSSHGKSPAEMLKMLNPKQFEKFLNDPSLTNKFSKDTGIMASDMVKDMIKKTKTDRTDMIEQLLSSARSIKKGDDNILTYKNKIIEEMVSKGMDRKTAETLSETLSKSLMKEVGPKGAGPKVTEQGLLELENIQKNLLTKDRQLQASGGRVSLSGGGLAGMLGE